MRTLAVPTRRSAAEAIKPEGLARIADDNPGFFTGVRQNGVIFGLEFPHPDGAKYVMRELYQLGVWAIFSTLDPRVLQYKPGILMSPELAEELLDRTAVSIAQAAREAGRGSSRTGGRR